MQQKTHAAAGHKGGERRKSTRRIRADRRIVTRPQQNRRGNAGRRQDD